MNLSLPEPVERAVAAHLRLIDQFLPSQCVGYFLVGSAALNDFVPGESDIDFVAVLKDRGPTAVAALRLVHRLDRSRRGPRLDGVYVTEDDLGRPADGADLPHVLDRRFVEKGAFAANPVTWYTLVYHAREVRGELPPVAVELEEVKAWCRDNLGNYWKSWSSSLRAPWGWARSLHPWSVAWGVFGVARIVATLEEGVIISKGQAAAFARRKWPDAGPLVDAALAARQGEPDAYGNPWARRKDLLAFLDKALGNAS